MKDLTPNFFSLPYFPVAHTSFKEKKNMDFIAK
jgi:hypothetical protein